ncbi:hypothetical protein ACET3Z_004946 [Daucus carota]
MTEELEKAKQDLINTKTEMMSEIDKLKKMITAGVIYSPGLCDKGSSEPTKKQVAQVKPPSAKELVLEEDVDCVALYAPPATKGEEKELCPQPKKNELKALQIKFTEAAPPENVPKRWRILYKHAMTIMKEIVVSVKIPCDRQVFGCDKKLCLLQEELLALLQFNMVGQSAKSAYMMNLYNELCEAKELDTFGFFNPGLTYNINKDFKSYVVKRLREGPDRIYFIPHNTKAVRSFNAETGRTSTMPKVKNLSGTPKQPSGYECAYAVMRYMKEIIEDKDFSFHKKWMSKSRKCYEMDELDEVRNEALGFIEQYII